MDTAEQCVGKVRLIALMVVLSLSGAGVIVAWLNATKLPEVERRDDTRLAYDWPESEQLSPQEINTGTLIRHDVTMPPTSRGNWSQFRGPSRSGIADPRERLLETWPTEGPQVLWRVTVGEGHAGPAVRNGRVYIIDYDRDRQEDAIRCLSLADGAELWRYTYYVPVKRNHGMSRTVPAVTDRFLVAMGPKCHVNCLDARTGERVWSMDLVKDFGTTVPPWYAGQCPLIDDDVVILAPGGETLLMAVELATGKVRWKTPNPDGWKMTHSSVMPIEVHGSRQYVYCTTQGVIGVDVTDGRVLWKFPDWKIKIATIPSPLFVPPDRLFFSGGYGSGSMMVRLIRDGSNFLVRQELRLDAKTFGADQQTPILLNGHIYGVVPDGRLACMDLSGRIVWTSGMANRFGLGPFIVADGKILVLADQDGTLHMIDATPDGYREYASAKVMLGHDAWGPMALVDGKLLLRDLTEMVCVQAGENP